MPPGAAPTAPYFLRRPLAGDLYDWDEVPEAIRGEAFGPPPLTVRLDLQLAGRPVTLTREVVHRERDQALGEIRRPLRVVPPVEVAVAPAVLLLPRPAQAAGRVRVRLRSHSPGPVAGKLRAVPDCPGVATATRLFASGRRGERERLSCLAAPAGSGSAGAFRRRARGGGTGRRCRSSSTPTSARAPGRSRPR